MDGITAGTDEIFDENNKLSDEESETYNLDSDIENSSSDDQSEINDDQSDIEDDQSDLEYDQSDIDDDRIEINEKKEEKIEKEEIQPAQKYIPPSLRRKILESKKTELETSELQKKIRGILNRVSEGNLTVLAAEIENYYESNSRYGNYSLFKKFLLNHKIKFCGNLRVY